MTTPQAQEFARKHCLASLGKNIKQYYVRAYEGGRGISSLGFPIDFGDVQGRVVAVADGYVGIKFSPNRICVVPVDLCSLVPNVGDEVATAFYKALRFDGKSVSGKDDGNGSSFCIGNATQFPVTWSADKTYERYERDPYGAEQKTAITNQYLIDMISHLEGQSARDGRKLVAVIRDAYVGGLTFNDPPYAKSCDPDRTRWPSIELRARSKAGDEFDFAIRYERASDTFSVEARGAIYASIHYDQLSEVISEILDDDTWRFAKVTVTKAARVPKPLKAAA